MLVACVGLSLRIEVMVVVVLKSLVAVAAR